MRQGGGQRRSSVAGSIVIGAGDSGSDSAYAGKDGRDSAGNNGTVVGRTAIGWSTGDTAYGAFSNAKGSSVLNSNFGLADSFDSLYTRPSGDAFHLTTNSNKLSSNKGGDNVALGFKSSAFGLQSVSLGMKSIASGTNALSVGTHSVARDSYSVAIGSESKGMGEASVAVGTFSNALGNYQLDFTKFNDINNDGYSTITQPEQTYQTSNGSGSLKDNSSKYQLITSTLKTGTDGSTTMESKITAQNTSSNKEDAALGVKAIALGDRSASIGVKTVANGTAALAVGTESVARTDYTIAQGYQAKAWEEGAIAIGKEAKANAQNAIVLGNGSSNQSQNALVLGNEITLASGNNSSVVIGHQSTIATNGETRGTSSYDSATIGGLTYGGFTGNPTSVFSIGPSTGRTLQHVAAGQISATSLDAINGSQLYRTNLALGNLATTLVSNLGGNAAVVNTNGDTLGNLTFSNIGNTGQDTVHGAIQKIADSTVTLAGNSGTTTAQNRQTNSSFGIKGADDGGITTTASGSDVQISLDDTTKTTLAKVAPMETKVNQIEGDLATTNNNLATTQGDVSTIQSQVNNLSSTLKFEGDTKTNEPQVNLKTETLKIKGKENFVTTSASGTELTIDLAESLKNKLNNLPTNATQDIQNITNKLGDTALTTVNGNTTPTTITQAINQITNAVNSGWEIQQGGNKKGDIGAGKKVNFANGNLTTASVEMPTDSDVATVKFDVQTTQLTNDSNTGTVSATDENKLVTAGDIATAINTATSSLSSSLAFRGDNNKDVAATETGDTNTKVDLKTQTLKVLGTAGQITTQATTNGLTIGLDSAITDKLTQLETSSTSAAGDITSIKNLLGDTNPTTKINGNNTAPTSISDAVNQLTTAVNTGWKLKGNGSEVGDIGATEAVDFVNGTNTTATVTEKTADKPATVSFSVNTATLANDSTTGKITAPTTDDENKLVTAGNLATVVNNAVDPDKLAANVKLSYTSTNGTSTASPVKKVSLSQGLNFKSPDDKLTITANDNGEVLFQAKDWTSDINTAKTEAIADARTYTDTQISGLSSSLKFTGDTTATPEPSVDLKNQKLAVNGTSGYVTTKAEGQTLTIDLDSTLKGKLNNLPTNVNESLQTINNKIGTAPADAPNAQTSPAGADGLNGKSLTEQINALRDGTAGNVVYTDPAGNRLVKGADGNYYPKDTALGADGLPTDKTVQPVAKDQIVTTTVNPDGSTTTPTQMGNVKSGLGLDGTGADGTSGSPSDPKAITAEKAKEALNGKNGNPGLLAMEGANNLNKVATVGDLQALAQAGIDFLGNEAEGKAIHKTLGSTLKIEGKSGVTYDDNNKSTYSADNLITHNDNDTLRIEMLKTPTFEGVKLATNGGTPISLTPDANGTSLTLAKNGTDGTNTPVELKGIAAGTTDESAINKAQLDELKNQLGLSDTKETSPEASPAGKDGLDGKTLTEKTNALRDGLAGNVVYTDPNGNRLVKGSDGNYYPAGTQMGENGLPQDTNVQPVDKSTIVATTVSPDGTTTTPTQMGNVKSGLGLDGSAGNDGTNADPKNPQALTADAAKKAVAGENGQSGLLTKSGADLNKVATVGDLQALAQAGIDFLGNEAEGKAIHKTLGSTLKIEGKSNTTYDDNNKSTYSADNLITHNDNGTLRIEMLKTPTFEGVKLATNGGTPISLTPDANGTSLTLAKNGADGTSSPVELKGIAAGTADDSAINKGQLDELKNQLGLSNTKETSPEASPAGKDGLDGKTLTEKTNALRDGLAGNVVYTDPNGNRLVKGSDGNYYPAGTQMGDDGLPTDGTQPVDKSTIVATTVNPDGTTTTPTQMGNVKSGLGLDGAGEDGTGTTSSPKAITAQQAKDALNGKDGKTGLLAMEGANNLNKVATVGDLQALAQAGIDFLGNEESTQSIHKTLGSTLNIEGKKDEKYSEANKANYSADNLITHNDNGTLRIEMLKTPNFESVQLGSSAGEKITLTPDANTGKLTLAKTKADGSPLDNPADNKVVLDGLKAGETADSAVTKGQLDELASQIGTPVPEDSTGTAGADGLNGKTLAEKVDALRDGTAGNVVYTDPQGNRLVKGDDGKYYPAGTQFNEQGLPVDKQGQPVAAVPTENLIATTVNPDGSTTSPVQMGNVKSGLGLDGAGEDGTGTTSSPKAITAQQAKDALNGKDGKTGLLAMEGANNLNKVATVGDLQALAQAGIDFLGNEESTQSIHKTLGSTLNIEGKKGEKYSDTNKANYSADNLITHNDDGTLRIEMLKTPTFEGVKLATNGGTPISLAPSEDGSSLTFSKPSDDGSSTMPVELKGVAAGTTENSAINKAQLDELKNQLGLSDTPEVSPTESPAGKDGLDGKTLTEKANALRDGLAGNVVYTDPNGNRLVKGSDGKYYPAEQVGNKVQGTDGKWYPEGTTFKDGNPIAKDGSSATALADADTPKEVAKDSIVSTAVNPDGSTANPIQMGNVKSGLGLDGSAGNNGQDANAADPKAITAEAAKNAIAGADGQSGLLTKSGADLNKVATVGDLQALAQAGLDFNGNNTDAVVHRPLGTKLEIVGDSPATNFASAVGNINVFGDPTNNKLVIQLSKVLTNITSIGGGVKDSVTDKTSTSPEDQKAQLTFNDDDLALNNKTLSGVKSAIKPATETQDKTMLDHLKEAAKDKGSSVVNVEDLAEVTAALETELTDKGLSFGGDSGEKVSRKLGEQLDVKGGVTDPAKLTDDNIGVVTDPDNNALIVKLAKEISDISSITTETKDGQSATFNSAGMTITGSDDKAGQSASYGLGGTTLTNGENKAELKPESLTFSDATNPDGAKSSLSKDSLNFTKEDGSKGISVNGKDGTISNLADRTLVGKDGNGPLSSDYGTGDNRNNAATEGALKDLADKLGVSTPNTLPIDSATGPSGADGLNGTSVLDKIQALRDGTAGNTVYTNEQGERLVKITTPDGSSAYYKAGDLTKDPTTGALTPNPNTTPVPSTNIVISNVNPDGSTTSPTQIANVKSGLGLDGSAGNNGVDGNPANPQAITADAAQKAIAGTDGQSGLLTKSGADLNKVATVGDLQALAQAGLDFVGNNEENVHRPLGTQLKVVGDGVDSAKAESFESATGNINVKSNATDNSLTVQLAKDLKNLTSSEFKDAEGNTTTVNGAGITITPPAKDDGSVAPSVSLSSKGLDNGGNKITNLAKGEDDGDAVTIAQLKELTQAVTGSSNINIANKEVNKDNKGLDDGTIFEGETSGDVLVQDGKPVLKTYNVSDQKEYLTNSVYTAISNMNEQGIKFFHTNDGKTKQTDQASNTEDSSASGAYATAVGYQSSAEGENSLAMGSGSVVKGENSIVIGSEGSVHGSDSISVGTGNEVFGNNSGAFGDPSIINATSSYLVGNNSTLGSGDELTALVEERKALTRPTRPEKLEAKRKTESDQDYQNRVNDHLEKMMEYNTALADYMEKREAINEKITALSEKTQGVMAMGNNVTVTQGSHGALVMGSNSYVNVLNSGLDTNIQGIAIGNNTRVDTNASSVALGSGAHALQSLEALQAATVYAHEQAVGKGSEVIGEVSFGKEGEYRRLTNVAAGAADTDAVNVSQLKGVASNINQQLNNLSQNISGVAASSAAMANLPQAYLPGKSMVAVSTGYHKGQSAIALGVSRVADNGKLIIKASASHNTQNDFTGGIGVGYQW
ncbi:YadA-like family protein [Gallibacterium anatis]|uniref:YadA-like family protein n=2 Tax=Gallibacterium anatis TaxID=750 RepID=UPI003005C56D